jgi:hypothetical protein
VRLEIPREDRLQDSRQHVDGISFDQHSGVDYWDKIRTSKGPADHEPRDDR